MATEVGFYNLKYVGDLGQNVSHDIYWSALTRAVLLQEFARCVFLFLGGSCRVWK